MNGDELRKATAQHQQAVRIYRAARTLEEAAFETLLLTSTALTDAQKRAVDALKEEHKP